MEKLKEMSDEELIKTLRKYGIQHGPIVGTTRTLYEKKLLQYEREKTKFSPSTSSYESRQQYSRRDYDDDNGDNHTYEEEYTTTYRQPLAYQRTRDDLQNRFVNNSALSDNEAINTSGQYTHKSGAQKRKLQAEPQSKELTGRQLITKYSRKENVAEQESTSGSDNTVDASTSIQLSTSDEGGRSQKVRFNLNVDDVPKTKINRSSRGEANRHDDLIATASTSSAMSTTASTSSNIRYDDPGTWPTEISDDLRQNIVGSYASVGFDTILKLSNTFPADHTGNIFQKTLLYSKTKDIRTSKAFPREWLIWSESKESLHCLACTLFASGTKWPQNISILVKEGFSPKSKTWKRLSEMLPSHESSSVHKNSYLSWKSLELFLKGHNIDKDLQLQIQCEATKWKAVLQRILDVTLFLSSRGLAFQGDTTRIGDVHNGNFLGVLELLANYDEIMREYLANVQKQQLEGRNMKGQANYLSWQSQNEFIALCGKKLLDLILKQREEAIYYGVIVDTTPDDEQNVLLLRYVCQDADSKFEISERFVQFLNFSSKTSEAITNEIISTLDSFNIPLDDCRSQRYDSGANMRGQVNGVQSRVFEKNNSVIFSPCGAQSLTRVGVNAAKLNPDVVTFFGNLESLYSFFSSSAARWEILKEFIPLTLHSLSETSWSERIQAIRPIAKHYPGVIKALDAVLERLSSSLTSTAHNTILGLKKYFTSFKGLMMTSFWYKVLECMDQKNVVIQSKGITLDVERTLVEVLVDELQQLRDSVEKIFEEAKLIAKEVGISLDPPKSARQTASRKEKFPVVAEEEEFKISVMFPVLDLVISDLKMRFSAIGKICDLFDPVLRFMDIENEELKSKVKSLVQRFKRDLTEDLFEEIVHMKSIYKTVFNEKKDPLCLLQVIYNFHLQGIFVNFCLALRLFCTIPVTVPSTERSFSRVGDALKTWQGGSTSQERLNKLAVLAMENELAKTVDFSDIINQFAQMKAREKLCQ
ncbi:zinc finger MYM-type protein 1-like [Eleutherodactylus coqui]|uniref:zinc finger MYM-type protein 1-like n=1 Tax=Eleutherodactylus coqui TaxID=57060 RepID=UPI0034637BDA